MGTSITQLPSPQSRRTNISLGALLALVGLVGHLAAAHAIAWNPRAYPDHIGGFFAILLVTGSVIALVGRTWWKRRQDLTVLIVGLTQAIFGIIVYFMRFHVM